MLLVLWFPCLGINSIFLNFPFTFFINTLKDIYLHRFIQTVVFLLFIQWLILDRKNLFNFYLIFYNIFLNWSCKVVSYALFRLDHGLIFWFLRFWKILVLIGFVIIIIVCFPFKVFFVFLFASLLFELFMNRRILTSSLPFLFNKLIKFRSHYEKSFINIFNFVEIHALILSPFDFSFSDFII